MKKMLIFLLSATLCFSAGAEPSITTSKPKTKHHHKIHKSNQAADDPILDAVASKHHAKKKTHKKARKTHHATVNNTTGLRLYSYSAYAINANTNQIIASKNPEKVLSIASISKLMTAMAVLDAKVNLDDYVTISTLDYDNIRNTFSRLKAGMQFKRRDLLLLALMSSENTAAAALARTTFNGGTSEFIKQMNAKAKSLGMSNTNFIEATGLSTNNKSTATDLAKMVQAAYHYDLIREDTTTKSADVRLTSRYTHHYINSDALVRGDKLQIELSKTGFINESGHCLVLYVMVEDKPIIMVFLNSAGKSGRLLDAMAVRNYVTRQQG